MGPIICTFSHNFSISLTVESLFHSVEMRRIIVFIAGRMSERVSMQESLKMKVERCIAGFLQGKIVPCSLHKKSSRAVACPRTNIGNAYPPM